jgi:transcriptional regulator with XRE-family HTH domain
MLLLSWAKPEIFIESGKTHMFAERLFSIRTQKGLTLENIADGIKSSKSTLSQYENGKRKPSHEMIIKVAEFLDVSADYLIGLTDEPNGSLTPKAPTEYHQLVGSVREFFMDTSVNAEDKDQLFKEINTYYWKYKGLKT